jgi:transposase
MAKKIKKDVSEIMAGLRKYITYEEIASKIGKSFNSIYNWAKDYTRPGFGDYFLLKSMLEDYQRKDKGELPTTKLELPTEEQVAETKEMVEEMKTENNEDPV